MYIGKKILYKNKYVGTVVGGGDEILIVEFEDCYVKRLVVDITWPEVKFIS